jgi:hypothetical protein
VHEVAAVPPPAAQVALFRLGVVADGDRPDRLLVARHPERGPERVHLLGHDPEVHRAKPLVHRRLQDQQGRHPGVDVPERHRPPGLVPVGPPFVRLRVAVEVGALARHRHDEERCGLRRVGDRGPGDVPELRPVGGLGQHEERLSLREPRRRPAHRVAENAVKGLPRHRLAGERPDHAPPPDNLLELHNRTLATARVVGQAGM